MIVPLAVKMLTLLDDAARSATLLLANLTDLGTHSRILCTFV